MPPTHEGIGVYCHCDRREGSAAQQEQAAEDEEGEGELHVGHHEGVRTAL